MKKRNQIGHQSLILGGSWINVLFLSSTFKHSYFEMHVLYFIFYFIIFYLTKVIFSFILDMNYLGGG